MVVKLVVMFGSDTWAVAEMGMKRLGTGVREIPRRMQGPEVKQGTQGIKIKQELKELYKDLDMVADMRKKTLEWIGYAAACKSDT